MERQFIKIKKDNFFVRIWKQRRDFSHHKTFGADPLPSKNWLSRILTQIGNKCTAYTAVALREPVTGKQYDPEAQWNEELIIYGNPAPDGVDLDTQMATGVKSGFVPVGATQPIDNAKAWFTVTVPLFSGMDMFDACKQALAKAPLSVALMWYREWDNTPKGIIPHTFNTKLGEHDTKIAYCEVLDGIEYLTVQGSWGTGYGDAGIFRFDRYMVNRCANQGVKYWTDEDVPNIANLGLWDALLINIRNLYIQLIAQKNDGTYPPHISRINDWARAIKVQEGWSETSVSFKHNNPGNLKYSTLTASWGATQGTNAVDGGKFCQFPTYDMGFDALCNFLTLAAENQLVPYHNKTLIEFTKIYALPPSNAYANNVASALGVSPNIPISQLL